MNLHKKVSFSGKDQTNMPLDPDDKGQGIVEYILFFILVVLVLWIIWKLLGPAIDTWIREFLSGI
jgi:hypothetical protein